MATIEFKGLTEYSAKLNRLSALNRDKIISAAVYDGAAVVADAIKAQIQALPTDDSHQKIKAGPTTEVKQALIDHMGIAPLRDDNGFLNVKVGFDGYDSHPTTKYPRGHPVPMLARAVQRGTSFMKPNPFVENAKRTCRRQAEEVMKNRVEKEIEQIMK